MGWRHWVLMLVCSVPLLAQTQGVDAISRFTDRIARGESTLAFDGTFGYVPSLLRNLSINVDSQVLVFSKTSLQRDHISPQSPRAIYFNDEVAVGSVHGGELIEIIATGDRGRLNFYTLNVHRSDDPQFQPETFRCGICHGPAGGMTVGTVYPLPDGTPFLTGANDYVDHRTPLEDRWGGWYVTGTHGSIKHLGNAVALSSDDPMNLQKNNTQNLTSLKGKFDTTSYLAPTSDIVALMTLEHQAHMTNLLLNARPQSIDEIVNYMLFLNEAPMISPVKGVSSFTETFTQRGPHDKRGRSLRDFDLKTRLFRYPLSYMVYSEAFRTSVPSIRSAILERVRQILESGEFHGQPIRTSLTDRTAILEIARDTIPDFPAK